MWSALLSFAVMTIIHINHFSLNYSVWSSSQNWYGPTTKRYQVSSGMSLSAPPWLRSHKDKNNSNRHVDLSLVPSIPPAPPAHLTAHNVVYEVDIPIAESTEELTDSPKDESDEAPEAVQLHSPDREFHDAHRTARDYGQWGKGAAREWAIRRRLGDSALSTGSAASSSLSSFGAPIDSTAAFTSTLEDGSVEMILDPPEPGRLRLLSGITCSFRPSTMTALMGESGAGKTTLLDVLAGYKTGGHISGDVNINGQPKTDATWRTIAGYCEQVDLHNPSLTVRESVVFASRMRLRPFSLPDDDVVSFANQILKILELEEFADMLVGDEAAGEGLPKHARKRLTVGVEMAGKVRVFVPSI